MVALLTQGNSENFKSRFNSAFLAGSDYSLLPNFGISAVEFSTVLRTVNAGNIYNKVNLSYNEHKTDYDILNGRFSYKDDEHE